MRCRYEVAVALPAPHIGSVGRPTAFELSAPGTFPRFKFLSPQLSVVFADPWWIGTKDENPDELRLPFPQGLAPGQAQKANFGGGAGQLDEATPPRTEKAVARKKKANSISPASDIGEDDLDPEVPDSTGESESPNESKSEESVRYCAETSVETTLP
ncbi:hypothetical protein R1sor_014278 [Riccia sorocarpa]|uniref:Uncharacterized protein n=1 Tax=Riccia sorocarpa TaxID=122646 RepID=A0ABD3HCT9_9MARC